ncbi:MAG: CRISPR-associated protein Cas2 [uncultured Sulfurovum sp.]|uniref:CRISPR-associated endoribonuclease Cas2 n=1 Tax=uncultured Sulfurovum sp. TaxID=269237 RepID=A0A6S6SSU6_9BACT|nr:MAG: CRISPR-associated protein Cas2 [uncultured Sulfurovum sp.]
MQRYVVAYDISNDKNRRKVGEALEAYGKRVNYSVFEIQLKSKSQKTALEHELLGLLSPKEDSLRFYAICQNCVEKSWSLGDEPAPFEQSGIYFF